MSDGQERHTASIREGGPEQVVLAGPESSHSEASESDLQDQPTSGLSFGSVLAACPDAVLVVDHEWIFRYANQQCIDLLASGPLIGENLFAFFPGNLQEPYYSNYTRCMTERVATDFEAYYPKPLNMWFRAFARPFGETEIIIFFRDISDRKQAELAREEVLSGTEEGVILLDPDLCLLYLNRRAVEILRFPKDSIGRHLTDLLPSLAESAVERSCAYTLTSQTPVSFQEYLQAPIDLWLDIDLRPSGRGVIFFFRDVTEQHRTREALISSEQRLHLAMAATSGVGTWDWDIVNDRVYADETFARLYGVSPEEAKTGAAISVFMDGMHPEDSARVGALIQQAIQSGQIFTSEYQLLQQDGSVRWVSARGLCTYAADGTPLRFPGVTFDITTRKQTEAALIQNEKLAAVGRLASSIAHEINNPLESVTNLIYLARHTPDPKEGQTYLSLAERELRRVSVIANQTLRFHKQSSRPREVTCDELIEGTLSIYQGRLVNSGIQLELRRKAVHPIVCFEGEIRQVLNNLVGNAIDAMHGVSGRLLIRSRDVARADPDDSGLVLTIADTGMGMSPETLQKAFEAFYTTKGIGGTGLGLWISAEIVARHGGQMRVRSRQTSGASGTVFRLFLPSVPLERSTEQTDRARV